jgi:hypothetical protein
MNHPKEELLALSAGGDLPWWSAWQVRRHLRSCEECRDTQTSYANMRVGLSALPAPEPPADLAAAILARIPRAVDRARVRFSPFGALAATAALAAAGVFAVLVMPRFEAPVPVPGLAHLGPAPPVLPITSVPASEPGSPEASKQIVTERPQPPTSQLPTFATVDEAEAARDLRYLASFAPSSPLSESPKNNPVLDQWVDRVQSEKRAANRHLPTPVAGLRAEMLRSHALSARVEVISLPGSPLEIVSAEALFAEGRLIDPTVEVRNVSSRVIRNCEIVWVFRDQSGAEFRGRLMASGKSKVLQPGMRAKLSETIVLEAEKGPERKAPELAAAKVFVRSATIGKGVTATAMNDSVWVPDRATLEARHLGDFVPLPPQTARLLDEYRKSGVQALAQVR